MVCEHSRARIRKLKGSNNNHWSIDSSTGHSVRALKRNNVVPWELNFEHSFASTRTMKVVAGRNYKNKSLSTLNSTNRWSRNVDLMRGTPTSSHDDRRSEHNWFSRSVSVSRPPRALGIEYALRITVRNGRYFWCKTHRGHLLFIESLRLVFSTIPQDECDHDRKICSFLRPLWISEIGPKYEQLLQNAFE